MARVVRTNGQMLALDARAGTLIQIWQGFTLNYREVLSVDDPLRTPGAEGFVVLERFVKPMMGSGVFRVRADGTLQHLESNYDSSD